MMEDGDDNGDLNALLKNLSQAGRSRIFVSPGLHDKISVDENGVASINLDGENKSEQEHNQRGTCANPDCPNDDDGTADVKLKRCMRCFSVDYCSRECQRQDWKRHKCAECKVGDASTKTTSSSSNNPTQQLSWQALTLVGEEALQKGKYPEAVQHLQGAVAKAPVGISSIYIDLVHALLGVSGTQQQQQEALKYAYKACELDAYNPMALVAKTKCHMALGDTETAFFTIYTCENSHALRSYEQNWSTQRQHVTPLLQEIMRDYLCCEVPKLRPSPTDFPLCVNVASVPFTVEYNFERGQAGIIQSLIGKGWKEFTDDSMIPKLAFHSTAIANNGEAIVFGGNTPTGEVNTVYRLRDHVVKWQECSGDDMPPPVQGHSSCIVGNEMYTFGGRLDDMYVLDMESWIWRKETSLMRTLDTKRPECNVLFSTLSMIDDSKLLLIGGQRPVGAYNDNGCVVVSDENLVPSDNMHVYSLSTKTWEPLQFTGVAPRVWGHSAHVVDRSRLLVFGGHVGTNAVNDIHLLECKEGTYSWTKIESDLRGIPHRSPVTDLQPGTPRTVGSLCSGVDTKHFPCCMGDPSTMMESKMQRH